MRNRPCNEPAQIARMAAITPESRKFPRLRQRVQRQLRDADSEARVLSIVAENRRDEIGSAVDHLRQLPEIGALFT